MDGLVPFEPDAAAAPPPDPTAEPDGYVVLVDEADRIHFLDWGGPNDASTAGTAQPGILLIHGFAATAWTWAPVARRLRAVRHVVAADLRGHGLSDAPTTGYDEPTLVSDLVAVAEGSELLGRRGPGSIIVVGHGFGAMVGAWLAAELSTLCAGLVLVDGGWEDLEATTGLEPWEFLRTIDEPPEVLRSLDAYLADRMDFDPGTWDADQERAARAAVIELPAGRVEIAIHDHVRTAVVDTMFAYQPDEPLLRIAAPIVALSAAEDDEGIHRATLEDLGRRRADRGLSPIRVARYPTDGHNLMRYRPAEVAAAILAVTEGPP